MAKEISLSKRINVYDKYGGKCAYCGIDIKYTDMQVDHILAKHRGFTPLEAIKYNVAKGSNDIKNLNPSCRSCNASKNTFTIEQWRNEIALKLNRLNRDSSTFRILLRFGLITVKSKEITFYFERGNL